MSTPPLPASPALRVRLDYTQADGYKGGNRFYLGYAGSAPTAANCAAIASAIESAWAADMAALINVNWSLTEVDVLDVTTTSGAFGTWAGSTAATRSGTPLPAQVATNVEFDLPRRYRGGKPRIYWPGAVVADLLDQGHYDPTFITAMTTANAAFWTAVAAISVGTVGALSHVNLSYYQGFKNITNSSGRTRAVPTYRDTALVDLVNGYAIKEELGSQRRRRQALTD